jgi:hypothetical protein
VNLDKLCECGCGQPAPIAKTTWKRRGYIKGQPLRFISGHNLPKDRTAHFKHGHVLGGKESSEYLAYRKAKRRCNNPKDKNWKDYGGRGIKFQFESFIQFLAEIGLKPTPKLELDRIDNDGHYAPGNVRWATKQQQMLNRRKPHQKITTPTVEIIHTFNPTPTHTQGMNP